MLETDIEASTREEAWKMAQDLDRNQFSEIAEEQSWKIKTVYQSNEISSL